MEDDKTGGALGLRTLTSQVPCRPCGNALRQKTVSTIFHA